MESLANSARQRQEFDFVVKEILGASNSLGILSDDFAIKSSDPSLANVSDFGDVRLRKQPKRIVVLVRMGRWVVSLKYITDFSSWLQIDALCNILLISHPGYRSMPFAAASRTSWSRSLVTKREF